MMSITQHLAAAWRDARGRVAHRLLLDRQAEFWMRELDLVGSLSEVRARVLDVVRETSDVRTFLLRPNRRWRGHRAGQWTSVEVEIGGIRARRCYSISSAPDDPVVAITVKRVLGGRVSGWLHDHVHAGDVIRLGEANGDFVLPEPTPPRLLFLTGGSGITPIMSMLRSLAARDELRDAVLVHHAQRRHDVIFRGALEALAAEHSGLRLVLCLDDEESGAGGFDEARLAGVVPDRAARETFLCGPPPMMAKVETMWRSAGLADRLHTERFSAPPSAGESGGADVSVHLVRSRRTLAVGTAGTLLEQLERAGTRPPSGCRVGICRSCTTMKRTGTVRNVLTGARSSAPDEAIQLCVTAPCTDVELSL